MPLLPVLIQRDDVLVHQLQAEAEGFWQQVEQGIEPEKDPERDLYIPDGVMEQAQWHKLAMVYRRRQRKLDQLKEELEAGKSQQKLLQDKLQRLMGAFRVAESNGLRLCRSECAGSVDYQKALETLCKEHQLALPELESFRRKGREQVRVTLLDNSGPGVEAMNDSLLALSPDVGRQSFYF